MFTSLNLLSPFHNGQITPIRFIRTTVHKAIINCDFSTFATGRNVFDCITTIYNHKNHDYDRNISQQDSIQDTELFTKRATSIEIALFISDFGEIHSDYSISNRTRPLGTLSPTETSTDFTTPSLGAKIMLCIFMAIKIASF